MNRINPTHDLVENNLNGIKCEKLGDVDSAISLYSYNIDARFDGSHPYDRLATIYRKVKQYDDEIDVLNIAIDVFTHDVPASRPDRKKKIAKYKERLLKAEDLYKRKDTE